MDEVIPLNVHSFGQKNHRKPEPGAARGAGESTVSVESLCPRLESVRRGKPLQPTPAGDGLRPAGAREEEHPPAVRQRYARRTCGVLHPTGESTPTFRRVKAFPYDGKVLTPGNGSETVNVGRFFTVHCSLSTLFPARPRPQQKKTAAKRWSHLSQLWDSNP